LSVPLESTSNLISNLVPISNIIPSSQLYSQLLYNLPLTTVISPNLLSPISPLNSIQKLSLISPQSAITAINPISALSTTSKNTSN
jgi:hypothetical protein